MSDFVLNSRNDYYLWSEKYRPQTIDECVLPEEKKEFFKKMIADGEIQSMFFHSGSGRGKSSAAKALANELNADLLVINGSEERNIDIVRTNIKQFATSASINNPDAPKIVLIDEADHLNKQSTQPALRAFMEQFSKNTRFIFTANYPSMMMPELISRMVSVDFDIKANEKKDVLKQFALRVFAILDTEKITYNKQVVAQVINKYFPDYRKTLNELQRYSISGELSSSIMDSLDDDIYKELVKLLQGKSFSGCRKWLAEQPMVKLETIIIQLWKDVDNIMDADKIPQFVLLANKYQVSATQSANQSINTLAFFTELMLSLWS